MARVELPLGKFFANGIFTVSELTIIFARIRRGDKLTLIFANKSIAYSLNSARDIAKRFVRIVL